MSVDTSNGPWKPTVETMPPYLRRRLRHARQEIRDAKLNMACVLQDVRDWIESAPDPVARNARQRALGLEPPA